MGAMGKRHDKAKWNIARRLGRQNDQGRWDGNGKHIKNGARTLFTVDVFK